MKKYLFFILTICFSIGIIISDLFFSDANLQIIFFLLILLLFIPLLKSNNRQYSFFYLLISIVLGFFIHQNYNRVVRLNITEISEIRLLQIKNQVKNSAQYTNYITEDMQTKTPILLHLKTSETNFYPNDELIIHGKLTEIQSPKNPNQFNYKQFLSRKKIHYELYTNEVISLHKKGQGWKNWVVKSKEKTRNKLAEQGYTVESRSLISSMILGDRTELSPTLNQSYRATGVVHILSISGLHVMMIFAILQFILQPLIHLKNGRKIRLIISLIVIWVFAFYVELKSPVFRSALMITIYYLSELLRRPKNIYHTLSLSAFIILLFQPNQLFDVGFQLSFSAVFFIVWLNPIFEYFWKVKNTYLKKVKTLTETSISAQLGTIPVSVFYFNQFSGLFLLGNLILIPASFLMISGGIIGIILSVIEVKIPPFIWIFNQFIHLCNQYIYWLAHFDFVAKDVYISLFTAILIGVILCYSKPLFLKKSRFALLAICISLLLIEIDRFSQIYKLNHSNEFIVFNQYKNSIIGIRNARNLSIFSANPIDEKTYEYVIKPYKITNRIQVIDFYSYQAEFKHPQFIKKLHSIETNSFSILLNTTTTKEPFFVLIHQSNLYDFEKNSQTKRVIADASNYPSILSELEKTSDSIVWKTSEKGYYSFKF